MRIVAHDLAVLARAGFGFIGVDHEITRTPVGLLGHERPFESGRKPGAAAAALARGLDLVDDGVPASRQDCLGAVPGAARARGIKRPAVMTVEIFEDAVLVGEHVYPRLGSVVSAMGGFGSAASCASAASPGFLVSASRSGAPVWTGFVTE